MDIVIVSQYMRNLQKIGEGNNSRFLYLANMLKDAGHKVEIISTDFDHGMKTHYDSVPTEYNGIKITVVHEIGYPKNISLKRLRSNKTAGESLTKYLSDRKRPDVIYAAIPSPDFASAAVKYCKNNGVKFIIDVQDLWPEAFKMVFRMPVISDIVFAPMKKKANSVYAAADEIVAVSQTYANRALSVNKKCNSAHVVYLGTEKKTFDLNADKAFKVIHEPSVIKIAYIGSLGDSYDIDTVIDAIKMINSDKHIELVIMGDGEKKSTFETHANAVGIHATFTGMLGYPQMCECLMECDIAVNPIKKGSAGSIINKVGDYAMAGLPVVNTQECQEYRDLLEKYGAGINCGCENVQDVAEALTKLIEDDELRKDMAAASLKVGEECFDRLRSYVEIITSIEGSK